MIRAHPSCTKWGNTEASSRTKRPKIIIVAWSQHLDNDLFGLKVFSPDTSPIWTPSVRKQKSSASFPPMRIKARGKKINAFFHSFSIRGNSFQ